MSLDAMRDAKIADANPPVKPKTTDLTQKFYLDTGFQLTDLLLKDQIYGPDLQKVKDFVIAGEETKAIDAFLTSKWYITLGKTAASRHLLEINQNPVYLQELEVYKAQQKARLIQLGVKVTDPAFELYLKSAFDGNLTDEQINTFVSNSKDFGHAFGGNILSAMEGAKQYAYSMGISYDQKRLDEFGRSLFLGQTTQADIEKNIRAEASSAFPVYADLINKGVTMDSISSAYKQSMANILEINPNAIDLNDPTLRRAMQGMGTSKANGEVQIAIPLWQFENELRQDVRWQYTNNAREQSYNMVNQVLSDFGVKG
jgi:hypothetical protein